MFVISDIVGERIQTQELENEAEASPSPGACSSTSYLLLLSAHITLCTTEGSGGAFTTQVRPGGMLAVPTITDVCLCLSLFLSDHPSSPRVLISCLQKT